MPASPWRTYDESPRARLEACPPPCGPPVPDDVPNTLDVRLPELLEVGLSQYRVQHVYPWSSPWLTQLVLGNDTPALVAMVPGVTCWSFSSVVGSPNPQKKQKRRSNTDPNPELAN